MLVSARFAVGGVLLLIWWTLMSALATANTVPTTKAFTTAVAITVNDVKPSQCSGITLTTLVTGAGTTNGTNASELILGGPGAQTINGGNGNDCILGGGGNDSIDGGSGTDVCIGGPGTNTFNRCESTF